MNSDRGKRYSDLEKKAILERFEEALLSDARITVQQAADTAGVTRTTIARWLKPKRRPPADRGKRYASTEIEDALPKFELALQQGLTELEAADLAGVSRTSLLRWKGRKNQIELADRDLFMPKIDLAIAILLSEDADDASYRIALFDLVVWLRFPSGFGLWSKASVVLHLSYLKAVTGAETLADLPPEEFSQISRLLRLDDAIDLLADGGSYLPSFEAFRIDGQKLTDRDISAQTAWFFLRLADCARGEKPSIEKVHRVWQRDGFRDSWRPSRKTFGLFWKKHAPTMPFSYVEIYESPLSLQLDPAERSFVSDVDDLLSMRSEIRDYLLKSKTAIREFSDRLDVRARNNIRFPHFDDSTVGGEIKPPQLTAKILGALSH